MYIVAFISTTNHIINDNCACFDTLEDAQLYLDLDGFEPVNISGGPIWIPTVNHFDTDHRLLDITHAIILKEQHYPDNPIHIG